MRNLDSKRGHPARTTLVLAALSLAACAPSSCPWQRTSGPECRLDQDCKDGERCVDGSCQGRQRCASDAECPAERRCDALTKDCVLKTGFGTECGPNNNNVACAVGQFCALGKCRDTAAAVQCSRRFQCPVGQVCDRVSFYCIEEAPCTLAADAEHPYPELSCDPGDVCDAATGACMTNAPPECTPGADPNGCAPDELCNGAKQCVQCISNQDCGAGLRCNTRAGLCESTSLCRRDSDCNVPLTCDRATALCTIPPPPCQSDYDCQLGDYCDRTLGTCQPREGKCDDDRLEPDETPAAARTLDLSTGTAHLQDLVLCPGNADVFGLDLSAGDGIQAVVQGASASSRTEVTAIAPDQLTTLRFAEAPPRGNGTVSFVADADGRYFVRVISPAGKTGYSLLVTRTASTPCLADALEPNNAPEFAVDVDGEGVQVLTLCPVGDQDWLRLRPPPGGTRSVLAGEALDLALHGPAGEDFDLLLLDDSGHELGRSAGPTAEESLRFRFAYDTTVLVGVVPYGSSKGPYALSITREAAYQCVPDAYDQPPAPPPGDADAGEPADASVGADAGTPEDAGTVDLDAGVPDAAQVDAGPTWGNNTRGTATPVDRRGLQAELTLCPGDEDWFVVAAQAYQRVLATATWPAGEPGVELQGYDDQGTLRERAVGTRMAALSLHGNDAGRAYVRAVGAVGPYALNLAVESLTSCQPDNHEPDNTVALAGPAPAEGVFTLCGLDQDLFRLDLAAGRRVRAAIDFSTADGDLDLAFLMADGVTPLAVSDGVSGHEALDVVAPAGGRDGGTAAYFLRVYAATSGSAARYHLVVDLAP